MSYPLKDWHNLKRGFVFCQPTWYSKHHLGLDLICKKGTPVFAPFNGRSEEHWGFQGGNTVYFYWDNYIMRVMHLSRFGKMGNVKEGQIIGYVGNMGSLSKGSHAHIDISKNKIDIYDIDNFIDPETFNFNNENMKLVIERGDISLIDEESKFGWSIPEPKYQKEIIEHFRKSGIVLEEPEYKDLTGYYIVRGATAFGIKEFFNL